MEKELIILAKSAKHGDFCVAGVDVKTGEWIRPVSNNKRHEGAVPLGDLTYSDGTEMHLLDKVSISFIKHTPTKAQSENYLYDENSCWVKTGISTIEKVIELRGYDEIPQVFYNSERSLSECELSNGQSLLLLNVNSAKLFIDLYEHTKLHFTYNGVDYKYFPLSDGRYKGKSFSASDLNVVFSLTGKHTDNRYYKMVATIFR